MADASEFGPFFRSSRKALGLTLREFCRRNGFDPGNVSKLERGLLPPPQAREPLEGYAKALKLKPGTAGWETFFGLAATATGRIPEDVLEREGATKRLPGLFRKLRPHRHGALNWVTALNLEAWANTLEARSLMPQLIRRLVRATSDDLLRSEFPAGEQVQRPGWDGIVEARGADEHVPTGTSGWEIGVDQTIANKAEEDFEKRSKDPLGLDPKKTCYVFVTPRKWQKKEAWRQAKAKLKVWKDIRVYDSASLEEWLERAPAVDAWFAGVLGLRPVGVTVLDDYWATLQDLTEPSLKPEVFLASRDSQCKELEAWLSRPPSPLVIEAASPAESLDFVVAYGQDPSRSDFFSARTLIVEHRDSWRALTALADGGLTLIAHPCLSVEPELVADAVRRGHRVILCSHSGRLDHDDALKLPRAYREDLARALEASGVKAERAQALARESGGSVTVLKRLMVRYPSTTKPSWSEPNVAQDLVPMLLCGSWDDSNEADRGVLERLSGRPYNQVAAIAERWLVSPDPPLTKLGSRWDLLSREDSWFMLAPQVPLECLARFKDISCEVLGEDDASYELPANERWQASFRNKAPRYSGSLRHGIAETLALLGARPEQLAKTAQRTDVADVVVQRLLKDQGWLRWASLSPQLPLLAEASPSSFLDAVDGDLQKKAPAIYRLFEQDGDPLFSRSPHTGLLWAIETLAWEKGLLSRVSLILAQLAANTKDGRSGNTPMRSLVEIYMPWYPQTTASVDQRVRVLANVLRRYDETGWRLLIELLPNKSQISMPTSRPSWRDWALVWSPGVTNAEHWKQVSQCAQLLVNHTGTVVGRWKDLIENFEHLPPPAQTEFFSSVEKLAGEPLGDEERRTISESLRSKIGWHNRFASANWALAEPELSELERVRQLFEPIGPVQRHAWLFRPKWEVSELLESVDHKREEAREEALREVLEARGWDGVLELLSLLEWPVDLGFTLASIERGDIEARVLPGLLPPADQKVSQFLYGYLNRRSLNGIGWVDDLDTAGWSIEALGSLLGFLPFNHIVWDLAESMGESVSRYYWRTIRPSFSRTESEADARRAITMLLEHGKPECAMDVIRFAIYEKYAIEGSLLLDALEGLPMVMADPERSNGFHLSKHDIHIVFQHLQERLAAEDPGVDGDRLARCEWALLQLLDGHPASPVTLIRQLCEDPGFFVEVLKLVFRPKESPEGKEAEFSEQDRLRARNAYHLLMNWKRVPGFNDNQIDERVLNAWIKRARSLSEELRLLEFCDSRIGQVFAHAPFEADGSWPCIPVRDALEEIATEEAFRGFSTGIFNKRGIVSKSIREGGAQERELAKTYRAFADASHVDWPRTAATLRQMAERYEEEARWADAEAMDHP